MKCWNEMNRDAYSYFDTLCSGMTKGMIDYKPDISVVSFNGTRIDKEEFIDYCGKEIRRVFSNEDLSKNYKFYLIANIEVRNKKSRIEKYKKVWKKLQHEWILERFIMGPEVEMLIGETLIYSSIAVFRLEDISLALQIISKNPYMFTIITSSRNDLLTERSVVSISKMAFENSSSKYLEIDYCNLWLSLCSIGDIVFRWGDSSEDAEVALIFNSQLFSSIKNITSSNQIKEILKTN